MTKKLTKEQVAEALMDNASSENEGLDEEDTEVVYYLHVKEDGTIVDDYQKADASFTSSISWEDYGVDWETWETPFTAFSTYDYERMDFKPFVEVVEDLTNQANEWLASIED